MTMNKGGGSPSPPTRQRQAPDKAIVTPEDEPSALKRGARILERLARKPGRDSR